MNIPLRLLALLAVITSLGPFTATADDASPAAASTAPVTANTPLPTLQAAHTARDFVPDGRNDEPEWQTAAPAHIEHLSGDGKPCPALRTTVRALWSADYLYLAYECPFTTLTVFDPPQTGKRMGLWDKDVVEAFIGADPNKIGHYTEYEWAPTGEKLDLSLDLPARDFAWNSGMESAVSVDQAAHVWRVEARIPMKSLTSIPPAAGVRWRIDLFRRDTVSKSYMAFSPTLADTYHIPERFGWLELTAPQ